MRCPSTVAQRSWIAGGDCSSVSVSVLFSMHSSPPAPASGTRWGQLPFRLRSGQALGCPVEQNSTRSAFPSFLFFAQQLLEYADAFVHVLFLQQERGKKAQHRILRAVEQDAFRQCKFDQGSRRN